MGMTWDADYGVAAPAFRLPRETRLGTVVLQVADLERSLDFYTRVLGFAADRTGGTAALRASGEHVLIELRELRGAMPVPPHGQLGLYHFAILLPDRASLGCALRHLMENGVHPGASDHLVSEALYLSDPDGLGIEIYADRPRWTWRSVGRQLAMATEPLDVRAALAAAGDARWQRMPAGTVIGHVHLHVRSIDEANVFYHETLGLDRMVWSYPGALFLSAGGYHHHLGVNTWAGARAQPAAPDAAQLLEWTIVVPDAQVVTAAADSLAAAGHEVQRDDTAVTVRDVAGTVIRIRMEG